MLSRQLRENEEHGVSAKKAMEFFDTFKAGQLSSNLLAETILENKVIDESYFKYQE